MELLFCGLLMALPATDSSTVAETIVVRGYRRRPSGWALDPTAAAESIDLRNRVAVNETLGEVLAEASGVRVLQSGGQGAFQGVSIRGAEPDHTALLIGDVPLGGTDRGAVDLSLLPLQAFERVDIFRGSAPAWLDQGQIGGLVRLVPRTSLEDTVRAEVGLGSFGGYWFRGEGALRTEALGVVAAATALTRANDYAFVDDRATPFVPGDDEVSRRQNADLTQFHGFLQSAYTLGGHRVELLGLGVHRDQGEPGPGHRQTEAARRTRSQAFGTVGYSYENSSHDIRLQAVLSGGWERDALDDRQGEIGLAAPKDTQDRFMGLTGRMAGQVRLTSWLQAAMVIASRHDRYDPEDRLAGNAQPSERTSVTATAEARLHGTWRRVLVEARAVGGRSMDGSPLAQS